MFPKEFAETLKSVLALDSSPPSKILMSLFSENSAIDEAEIFCECNNEQCSLKETRDIKFGKCERCGRTKYCSKKCQSAHWNQGHKVDCNKPAIVLA